MKASYCRVKWTFARDITCQKHIIHYNKDLIIQGSKMVWHTMVYNVNKCNIKAV